MEPVHLLDSVETSFVQASHGKRCINFLIDIIGFYAMIFLLGILWAVFFPEQVENLDEDYGSSTSAADLWLNLISILLFIGYYSLLEYATGGRSLGKFLSGTKVVSTNGTPLTLLQIIKRSAIRIIPFELFSCFGTPCEPWHDRWSNTMVIDIRQSEG